jgi:hypothetical protein
MADLLDVAIAEATQTPQGAELHRKSRRFDELRTSPAWQELREEIKKSREKVIQVLGLKALKGVSADELRTEGIYSRGYLDGVGDLIERPDKVHDHIEALINENLERIRSERIEAAEEESPYGV